MVKYSKLKNVYFIYLLWSSPQFLHILIRSWMTRRCQTYSWWCNLLQYKNYTRCSPVTNISGLMLPVDIPCVDTAIKTRSYQQPISWRKFYVLYPIGMAMKGTYLRPQITSIPQCYSTVITAGCKNTRIQEPETCSVTAISLLHIVNV
jgi:hypothetical protein